MRIKLIKDHVLGGGGVVVEVEQGRANYLISVGAGEEYVEQKPKPAAKKKAKPRKKKDAEG